MEPKLNDQSGKPSRIENGVSDLPSQTIGTSSWKQDFHLKDDQGQVYTRFTASSLGPLWQLLPPNPRPSINPWVLLLKKHSDTRDDCVHNHRQDSLHLLEVKWSLGVQGNECMPKVIQQRETTSVKQAEWTCKTNSVLANTHMTWNQHLKIKIFYSKMFIEVRNLYWIY